MQSRGQNPDTATIVTRQWLEDQEGNTGPQTKANASLVTRYTLTEGRLKGVSAGVAARYLKGKPIKARPVGVAMRFWKWSRRRPLTTALLAGMILSAVLGFAGVTWQWREAASARAL